MHADTIDPKLNEYFVNNDGTIGDGSVSPLPFASGAAAGAGSGAVAGTSATAAAATAGTAPPLPAGDNQGWRGNITGEGRGVGEGSGGRDEKAAAVTAAGHGVAGGVGAAAAGGLLQGSSLVEAGDIPSDPVLAMQMGARMALTGEFGLYSPPRTAWARCRLETSTQKQ